MTQYAMIKHYVDSFIKCYERQYGNPRLRSMPIINSDFIWEDEEVQDEVIKIIIDMGYDVQKSHDDPDGLSLIINKQ